MSTSSKGLPSPEHRPTHPAQVIPLHGDTGARGGWKWMAGAIGITLALGVASGALVYSTLRVRFQRDINRIVFNRNWELLDDVSRKAGTVTDSLQTVLACLQICRGMIASCEFDTTRMRTAIDAGHLLATEVADYLVTKGVPFREAHDISGHLVRVATMKGVELAGLDVPTLKAAHSAFEADIAEWLDPARAVDRRDHIGGPARARVLAEIERIARELE